MTRFSPARKVGLAMDLEDFGDAHARRALDFLVGIEKRQAELGCQALADGGLARAHQADQHDAARGGRRMFDY